ncbi:tryptophan 7-halogenase [Bosea sp. (in: a-proteobacteria)]|uniref:tryptophan 7-halogenase n=1 Tax=Bosea sp. (in: a-proteobacteria) TaxID=1871050 RepID=UPI003B3ADD09
MLGVPPGSGRLVIAGGGPAGWLAAAFLQRCLGPLGWSVAIVAGRGAARRDDALATGPAFTRLLAQLGLDRDALMRRCGGTYRLGSSFADWFGPGRTDLLPFGPCGPRPGGYDLFHYWLKARQADDAGPAYTDHSLVAMLAEQGLGPLQRQGRSPVEEEGDYGFHFATGALCEALRDAALASGVRCWDDRVEEVLRDERGIAALRLGGGARLEGDLFIDATGSSARLSGTDPGNPFELSPGPALTITRRTLPAPGDGRALTRYRANPSGYHEIVPLLDEAVETGVRVASAGESALLVAGRRKCIWSTNVVTLGTAAMVLPPLHGLGWLLVQRSLEHLLAWLPRGVDEPLLRDSFNREIDRDIAAAQEAISLCLSLPSRAEPFWAGCREAALSPGQTRRQALYEACGRAEPLSEPVFPETAHYHLFAAAGRWPRHVFAPVDMLDELQCRRLLESVRAQNDAMLRPILPHRLILAALHGRDEESLPGAASARQAYPARHDRLAAIRATAGGRKLAELMGSLGKPFAVERSIKAEEGRLQRERFLTSIHRTALGADPGRMLTSLAAELGLPAPYREAAAEAIVDADILHLGYEDGVHGPLYKLYVEWSARADRLWHRPDLDPGGDPVLVHRAYKWDPARPERVVTTLYHWPRVRSAADIRARLPALGEDAGGIFTAGLAEAALDIVEREGTGHAHFLEVKEEESPRLSYDLNLYATGLSVAALAGVIQPAFAHLAVPQGDIRDVLARHGAETLGHIAAGVGRRGAPFVTIYFGGGEA